MGKSSTSKEDPSAFNREFKEEFVTLFRNPKRNRKRIAARVSDMVLFVGSGFKKQYRDAEHRHDVLNEVIQIMLEKIERKANEINPDNNPSNYLRTIINREIWGQLEKNGKTLEEATDATHNAIEKPDIDPMEQARACREVEDISLKDLSSKVSFAKGIDREICRSVSDFEETGEMEHLQSALNYQRVRKMFLGEYLPLKVGTIRFNVENFVRFATIEG